MPNNTGPADLDEQVIEAFLAASRKHFGL